MKHDIFHDKDGTPEKSDGRNRRNSERRQIALPALIGPAHSDPQDFGTGTVVDISLGGIKFSVPKGTTIELSTDCDTNKISVLFTLPKNKWRTNVICRPQRVFESADQVQVGATVLNPDYFFSKSLRNIM
jgi:c-di-GMP-binding flagellar brake protein YcgR